MTPVIQFGSVGGLPGSAPSRAPSVQGPGERPCRRRPLTSEDWSVIAVRLRCGCPYAQIGAMIGRDGPVICRELAGNRARRLLWGRWRTRPRTNAALGLRRRPRGEGFAPRPLGRRCRHEAMIREMSQMREHLRQSLTWKRAPNWVAPT